MATRDFIINFFGGGALFNAAVAKLARPPVVWTPPRPPIPVALPGEKQRKTGDWATALAVYGKSILAMFNATPIGAGPFDRRAGDTIGRIALVGFSEGGQGMAEVLGCNDANKIDVCLAVDAFHARFIGQKDLAVAPPVRLVDKTSLWWHVAFAKLAATTDKVMVISHSSIHTEFASTTEVASVIWAEATKDAQVEAPVFHGKQGPPLDSIVWPNANAPMGFKFIRGGGEITAAGYCSTRPSIKQTNFMQPATFCWYGFGDGWAIRRTMNGLATFGWWYPTKNGTKDPSGNRDHVFQALMVLPVLVEECIVNRWNPVCLDGAQQVNAKMLDARMLDAAACTMGGGSGYYDGPPPAPLDNPYPLGVALPVLVSDCPDPGSGRIITGRPGDPCWADGGFVAPSDDGGVAFVKFIAGVAGLTLGWIAYDAWRRRGTERW